MSGTTSAIRYIQQGADKMDNQNIEIHLYKNIKTGELFSSVGPLVVWIEYIGQNYEFNNGTWKLIKIITTKES